MPRVPCARQATPHLRLGNRAQEDADPIAEQSRVERARVKRSMSEWVIGSGAERVPGVAAGGRLMRDRGGRMVQRRVVGGW